MNIEPVGIINSCYKEKFGIPRQPGLVPLAPATLKLVEPYQHADMVRGLDEFSHLWLVFGFHATVEQGWYPLVRPPRLGGNERIGVFASRSMFRPNGLGLSVCKLDSINCASKEIILNLSGVDLLDGTPVYDIKPYLPYADVVPEACGAYAKQKPDVQYDVVFTEHARLQCQQAQQKMGMDVMTLIRQILAQDPRPAFHRDNESDRVYGMKLYDFDVKWRYEEHSEEKSAKKILNVVRVLSL